MNKFVAILLAAVGTGCGQSPSRETLVGKWESPDKQHTLNLQDDWKFTHTTGPSPAIAADKETGIIYIAPAGTWSLKGKELTISMSLDGTAEAGTEIVLHILKLTDQDIKMRFGKLDPPFTLIRAK